MNTSTDVAPDLQVSGWLNTDKDLTLADLRGKVVVIEAFQMLCPGCVIHGIPLAQTIQRTFSPENVAVIGLHTVFEHHDAMGPISLRAFLHEYRITFPVAIDAAGPTDIPLTMATYGMRGTPSLLIIDSKGKLRAHHYGEVSPMQIGAEIATLIAQGNAVEKSGHDKTSDAGCTPAGCTI
ncbi:redoxin domain-containing protein [Sulfitobacter sp. F26204]|uniref:redoxin domain-containing protein n=1 Tax=Sulfitobacter sp. F26204 TaxID=2996014 RepID=UPI00225DD1CD|nr:redoxin domain-containing protein [Sulfitobacter sp. F26204]MCX7560700.1 redoxin domain-containing protein [Sulfitobacter sp. F26204]